VRSKARTASLGATEESSLTRLANTAIGVRLAPPWPNLLISSGRGSVAAALAIRKASKGTTFAIHIQTPYVRLSCFDVVVMPLHDSLRGKNVLVTRTALHRVTRKRLVEAEQSFKGALSQLPRPMVAVLVGGSNGHQTFSAELMKPSTAAGLLSAVPRMAFRAVFKKRAWSASFQLG
jgi:uncharacterized protein